MPRPRTEGSGAFIEAGSFAEDDEVAATSLDGGNGAAVEGGALAGDGEVAKESLDRGNGAAVEGGALAGDGEVAKESLDRGVPLMDNFAADLRGDIAAMREDLGRILETTSKVWAAIEQGGATSLDGPSQAAADCTLLGVWGSCQLEGSAVDEGTSAGPPQLLPQPPVKPPSPGIVSRELQKSADTATAARSRRKYGSKRSAEGKAETRPSQQATVPTESEEKDMLRRIFRSTEEMEEASLARKEAKKNKCRYFLHLLRNSTASERDTLIDILMGAVICVNAVVIGISMDHATDDLGWTLLDCSFSLVFIIEIAVKVAMHGFFGHFCGPMRTANCFDAGLIYIDLIQLVWLSLGDNSGIEAMPPASLFRMLRLVKLARLLRVVKLEIFKDVLSMVQGIIGGMGTLLWSMVLFFMVVYIMALLFREFLGRDKVENVHEFFNTVPRSMFTTFRCSFGDCSTSGGVPIFEYVHQSYGGLASLFYCLFVFSITIGIFNVISAIFVESTMAAAAGLEHAKKNARLQDKHLWYTRITVLIRAMTEMSENHAIDGNLSDSVDEVYHVAMQSKMIDELVALDHVKSALDDLDINPDDHRYLSELLDPDHGGTIGVVDFMDGVRRLRGEPRRSDIVNIMMMVRSLQGAVTESRSAISSVQEQLERICNAIIPHG